jgi:hypothetical protein
LWHRLALSWANVIREEGGIVELAYGKEGLVVRLQGHCGSPRLQAPDLHHTLAIAVVVKGFRPLLNMLYPLRYVKLARIAVNKYTYPETNNPSFRKARQLMADLWPRRRNNASGGNPAVAMEIPSWH